MERPAAFWPTIVAPIAYFLVSVSVRLINVSRSCAAPAAIDVAGLHIHHSVPGIGLVLVAGFLRINGWSDLPVFGHRFPIAALLFGAGAGLILDEASLLFTLDPCSYTSAMNVVALAVGAVLFIPHLVINLVLYGGAIRTAVASILGRA